MRWHASIRCFQRHSFASSDWRFIRIKINASQFFRNAFAMLGRRRTRRRRKKGVNKEKCRQNSKNKNVYSDGNNNENRISRGSTFLFLFFVGQTLIHFGLGRGNKFSFFANSLRTQSTPCTFYVFFSSSLAFPSPYKRSFRHFFLSFWNTWTVYFFRLTCVRTWPTVKLTYHIVISTSDWKITPKVTYMSFYYVW